MKQTTDQELARKLLLSRVRVLSKHGFYGLMLMHLNLTLEDCETAYTDGSKLAFGRDFLYRLTQSEVDFILMHEILHVALKHVFRGLDYNQELFNIACDIVVNSTILHDADDKLESITVQGNVSMHLIDGKEGYLYTAEEVYEKLVKKKDKLVSLSQNSNQNQKESKSNGQSLADSNTEGEYSSFDDHSKWPGDSEYQEDLVNKMIISVCDSINNQAECNQTQGDIPPQVIRIYDKLKNGSIDWRELLANFLNFKPTYDYSFTPVDRRYEDSGFFMPDYNEVGIEQDNINLLFLVDTSGSITRRDITTAYSEIKGAIEANIKMRAHIIFFDSVCSPMYEFDSLESLLNIKPLGGGGTSLDDFFKKLPTYVERVGGKIDAVICITDGYLDFPNESKRLNIPFIWLINNYRITPPWGVVARLES